MSCHTCGAIERQREVLALLNLVIKVVKTEVRNLKRRNKQTVCAENTTTATAQIKLQLPARPPGKASAPSLKQVYAGWKIMRKTTLAKRTHVKIVYKQAYINSYQM